MHGVDNQDSHVKLSVNGQCAKLLCLPAGEGDYCIHACMGTLSMVCACMVLLYCCRGFVEAYRDLQGRVCKAWEPGVEACELC